jgi:putative acetyltransferase
VIRIEKSLGEELAHLLQAHWLFCTSTTPIEHVYALDASRLFTPDITVFGARVQGELLGVGALRKLDQEHAELKSMHTLAKSRGLGIGKAMVAHIEQFAKEQGVKRISLETGTNEAGHIPFTLKNRRLTLLLPAFACDNSMYLMSFCYLKYNARSKRSALRQDSWTNFAYPALLRR